MKVQQAPVVAMTSGVALTASRAPNPVDTFEQTCSSNAPVRQPAMRFYLSKWDVPGVFTYNWIVAAAQGLQTKGDYNVVGKTIGGLMVLASPVVVPLTLAADVVNTLLFPGKAIYRALR